jgi:TIR domain
LWQKPPSRISLSYTSADRVGAEWIAWQLEEVGYQVKIQAWDFSPGANFVVEMQKATVECDRTIAVFSANYFLSEFAEAEWTAAFRLDPTVKTRSLFRWALRIANLRPPVLHHLHRSGKAGRSEGTRKVVGCSAHGPPEPSTGQQFPGERDSRLA